MATPVGTPTPSASQLEDFADALEEDQDDQSELMFYQDVFAFFDALEDDGEEYQDALEAAQQASGGATPTTAYPPPTKSKAPPRLPRLIKQVLGPEGIQVRDKLAFLLGSTLVWVIAFTLGREPHTFYRLYTGLGGVLMLVRYVTYRRSRRHYYMFDLCYFANLVTCLHLWFLPRNALLNKVTFAFNAGPVMWSIVAFRNSCVFHDLDKVTSLYLHLVPALVSWSVRWYPAPRHFGPAPGDTDSMKEWQNGTMVSLILLPMAFYISWAVAYYCKIFIISAAKIRERGYITLFNWVTSQRKGAFHAIAKRVPTNLQPVVYLVLHLCFCLTTFIFARICWSFYLVHTFLLLVVISASIWHGGSYYFDVFAVRYSAEITRTLARLAEAKAATMTADGTPGVTLSDGQQRTKAD